MNDEVIKALEEIGIENVYKILLAYTHKRISLLFWQHNKQTTTSGKVANDFVGEAILKAISGDMPWNKENCPSVISLLCGSISNQLSNSITSAENKSASSAEINELGRTLISKSFSPTENIDAIDEEIRYLQLKKKYKEVVDNLVKNDDDYIQFVFDEMLEGYNSDVIANRLNIDVSSVYKYQRRIRLAIKKLINNE